MNIEMCTRALHAMRHRGPDGEGVYFHTDNKYQVWLGHCRLAVLDLLDRARQPMGTTDRMMHIVFNGEIYNFQTLRASLQGHGCIFETTSDTEVLLEGWRLHKADFLNQLNGMFAFAVYDKTSHRVTLARDYFGEKPLYYFFDNNHFVFASTMEALMMIPEVRIKARIREASLQAYLLAGFVPSPHTLMVNIQKLSPGMFMELDISSWELRVNAYKTHASKNNEEYKNEDILELDALMAQAVSSRMVADVPVGLLFSGGLDSTLIALYMARLRGQSTVPAFTLTQGVDDEDAGAAAEIAKRLGLQYIPVSIQDIDAHRSMCDLLETADEPIADLAMIPLLHLSRVARQRVTVALTGDGGDEIFGGYLKYYGVVAAEYLRVFRLFTHERIVSRMHRKYPLFTRFMDGLGLPFAVRNYFYGSGGFLIHEIAALTGTSFDMNGFTDVVAYDSLNMLEPYMNRAMQLDKRFQLPDWYLAKSDRSSMLASLELRAPFLDLNIAQFGSNLPVKMKIRGVQTKVILKKLALEYLPHSLVYRSKRGFPVSFNRWIESFRGLHARVLETPTILDDQAVRMVLNQGSPGHIWRLMVLNAFTYKWKLGR